MLKIKQSTNNSSKETISQVNIDKFRDHLLRYKEVEPYLRRHQEENSLLKSKFRSRTTIDASIKNSSLNVECKVQLLKSLYNMSVKKIQFFTVQVLPLLSEDKKAKCGIQIHMSSQSLINISKSNGQKINFSIRAGKITLMPLNQADTTLQVKTMPLKLQKNQIEIY